MISISEQGSPLSRSLSIKWDIISFAIPAIIYTVAVLAFIKDRHALYDFPLDDAWIHQVYARSLSLGHGFSYNIGQQEAGSTSPLWAIVTAPAHWLELMGTD
ncbi:MAG: hypothetical protein OEV64_13305, partial [Desulfobulbaceae bacterium]|nr:hypothetical protein [Desulfobulbaceae bacterium]